MDEPRKGHRCSKTTSETLIHETSPFHSSNPHGKGLDAQHHRNARLLLLIETSLNPNRDSDPNRPGKTHDHQRQT
ncbi:hypothetical protein NEUTE2DRAFT_143591 [Neurospora tetrasperma FGSC 2509]|nr:hypothetical protein NEUTE2DRAFT_143591 [Neurospora tetrasperma FGSC 2509]